MISVIIPVYNEEGNIFALSTQLKDVLKSLDREYEIIYVDDGSIDGTFLESKRSFENSSNIVVIKLARNFGQTSAIEAGLHYAKGDTIITMDGDLQNDPSDITKLINKLDEGFDVVSGWRRYRKDHLLTRKIPSYIGNKIISFVTGVKLKDYGCGLKVYKKDVIKNIQLWGELHRILPIYAALNGATIAEVEVTHYPRKQGRSKYTIFRGFKLMVDLVTAKFMGSFATRPNYLFGIAGLIFLMLAIILSVATAIFRITRGLVMSGLFFITGFQLLIVGLLSEILMRIYYFIQRKPTYIVKEVIRYPTLEKEND